MSIILLSIVTLAQIGLSLLYRPEEVNEQALLLPISQSAPESEEAIQVQDRPSVLYLYHAKIAALRLLLLSLGNVAIPAVLLILPLQVYLGYRWERDLSHRMFKVNGQEGPITMTVRFSAGQIDFGPFISEMILIEGRMQTQRAGFVILSALFWSILQGAILFVIE